MDKEIKSGDLKYKLDFSGHIDWEIQKGVLTSQFVDTVLFYHPNFRFVYSNMVNISHISSTEFSFCFSDFFPYTNLFSKDKNEYRVIPALRVIYPVFNINTFLLLSEQIADKYEKDEDSDEETKKSKIL